MKHLFALMLSITLAACGSSGGSGGGSSSNNTGTRNSTIEKQLGMDLNFPSFSTSRTGTRGSSFSIGEYYVSNVIERDITIDGNYSGRFVEGETLLLSTPTDIRIFITKGGAFVVHVEHPLAISIGTGWVGDDFTSVPTGRHTYSGINTGLSKLSGQWEGLGSFAMNVDFDNKIGYLKGSTEYTRVGEQNWVSEIEGGFSINTSTGEYSASDLTLSIDDSESQATIEGNFHGSGAIGVTGEYTGQGNNSNIEGAIAGSRD